MFSIISSPLLKLALLLLSLHANSFTPTPTFASHRVALSSTSPEGIEYSSTSPLKPASLDAIFDAKHFVPQPDSVRNNNSKRKPPIPTEEDRRVESYFTFDKAAPDSTTRRRSDAPYRITKVSGDNDATQVLSDEPQANPTPVPLRPRHSNRPQPPPNFRAKDDQVWERLYTQAQTEASNEPLLISYLHSTILNHVSLESSLAFHMANKLSSPSMISTQVQSIFAEAFTAHPEVMVSIRADLLAVSSRDPACTCLPDAYLYFKGFHALVAHRVANVLWGDDRQVLAHYLQSQTSQVFQIDIHPNATLGSGIMLDHGTGIVIGSTAVVGDNCSILHHVTLGGSGRKDVDRHPKVGDGVLIGAGSSVLGNVRIGNRVQIGAGSLVIEDVDDNSVVVGVPAKVIGKISVDEEGGREGRGEGESPAESMQQDVTALTDLEGFESTNTFDV